MIIEIKLIQAKEKKSFINLNFINVENHNVRVKILRNGDEGLI